MNKLTVALENEGFEVRNWGYPSRKKTIEEHAVDLVFDLQICAENHPGEPIHFATHSLGGLIVRSALNHPDCPEEAKKGRAVLLAPPNQGSKFGRSIGRIDPIRKMLGSKSGTQLIERENFNELGEFPPSVDVLVISGKWDGKVRYEEGCLNTPHKHISISVSHPFIMTNAQVIYNCVVHLTKGGPK